MKSLTRAQRPINSIILLFLLTTSSVISAMQTTKNSNAAIAQIVLDTKPKYASTLNDIVKNYYEKNKTILVSTQALVNTLKRVQKIVDEDNLGITGNVEELVRAAQNGAFLLDKIAKSANEEIGKLAQTLKHPDVVDIIKYLYLQSCNLRTDETGFTEGIIFLKPGNKYTEHLRTFLKEYETRTLKDEKTQNSSNQPLILSAKTPDAFRLMCITITKTNQEKMVPFLNKFEDFYLIVPTDTKKGIRIKPERHPKVGVLNRIKVKVEATPDYGPEFNKETEIPSLFIEKFKAAFPKESKNVELLNNIGAMYSHLLKEYATAASDERKSELFLCLAAFEKCATQRNLRHLIHHIGLEIVLGDEELCESAFAKTEQSALDKKEVSDPFGVFLAFRTLRNTIRLYIASDDITKETEDKIRGEINDFYALITERGSSIKDEELGNYLTNTALTLKYAASLKADANTLIATLKGHLARPVFEKNYQATLNLKDFAQKLITEEEVKKSKALAAETDNTLSEQVILSLENYLKQDFPKSYNLMLTSDTKLNELIKKSDELRKLVKEPFFKLARLADNSVAFPKTKLALEHFNKHLIGTTIYSSEHETSFEAQKKFSTILGLLKTDIEIMLSKMITKAEEKGYICSTSQNGRRIINSVKRPEWLAGEKNPMALVLMKKNTQFFPSENALQKHVALIYEKNGALK